MRVICILILCNIIVFSGSTNAQEDNLKEPSSQSIKKNSLYLEILGNGVVWSINYERIIPLKEKMSMFLRIGGNEYHGEDTNDLSFNFIGAAGILFGGPKSYFESGIGYTWFSGFPDRLIALSAGYRYQGPKGIIFRATPMYIYNSEKGDTFGNSLWAGLSIGYSF